MAYDLFYDPNGDLVPPGKTHRVLDWQVFNDATLPTWLTAVGTVGIDAMNFACGRAKSTSGAVIGDTASFTLAFDVLLSQFQAIDLIVDGFSCDTGNNTIMSINLDCANAAKTQGMGFYQDNSAIVSGVSPSKSIIYNSGGNVTKDMHYLINGTNEQHQKTIGYRIYPALSGGYFMESDGVITSHFDKTTWVSTSLVRPSITLTTQSAAARVLRLSRLRIGFWS